VRGPNKNFNAKVQSDGSTDVNVQDQTTRSLDLYFTKPVSASIPTTLLTTEIIVTPTTFLYEVVVDNVTEIAIGDFLGIFSSTITGNTPGTFYFGEVLNIVGTTLTMDTPLDTNFKAGSPVLSLTREMNVDGSITPQVFSIQAGGLSGEIDVDITRVLPKMITSNKPEDSMFGDIIGGLLRGVVLRKVTASGIITNQFNWKTNGEISNFMFDLSFTDQTKVQGVNGIVGRLTYAGMAKHGVAIRLCPGDKLEFIIQDDLRTLLQFRKVAEGHEVTETI
jgi:hypothetical protein